ARRSRPQRHSLLGRRSDAGGWSPARCRLFSASRSSGAAGEGRPLPPVDSLAVSAGGENGAFGAGLLVGWTALGIRPTSVRKRPITRALLDQGHQSSITRASQQFGRLVSGGRDAD